MPVAVFTAVVSTTMRGVSRLAVWLTPLAVFAIWAIWAMWVMLVMWAPTSGAHAAMQLDRTRLIVPAAEGRAALHAQSEDTQPVLLQIWIDASDDDASRADPAALTVPFITDPPVVLLAPGTRRAVQVLRVDAPETLPVERESLYWLNVLEVPSAPASTAQHGHLQMSVHSRLKLFYRPQALAHYDAAALPADEQLRFTRQTDRTGQRWLVIDNPAPIHQTLATLSVHTSDAKPVELDAPMLAPFGQTRLAWPGSVAADAASVRFATISDDGNVVLHEQSLPPSLPTP